jgi:mono/diheme cytochrome c family protein
MADARKLRLLVAIFFGIALGLACLHTVRGDAPPDEWKAPARAARKKNPVPADEKSIALGKEVYVHQCLSCHGDNGHGDGPAAKDLNPRPHDLGAANVIEQSDGALFWKITEGKKPMPSFEKLISEDERWQAINYVRTFAPSQPATQPK